MKNEKNYICKPVTVVLDSLSREEVNEVLTSTALKKAIIHTDSTSHIERVQTMIAEGLRGN